MDHTIVLIRGAMLLLSKSVVAIHWAFFERIRHKVTLMVIEYIVLIHNIENAFGRLLLAVYLAVNLEIATSKPEIPIAYIITQTGIVS